MPEDGKAKRPAPTGSFMLDKQLARAAVKGQKILFMVNLGSNYEVSGYITGMDAYYFMVIIPVKDEETGEETVDHSMVFVHKSAAVTKILYKEGLDQEPPFFREEVERVGRGFWRTCEERYLGHNNSKQEATP